MLVVDQALQHKLSQAWKNTYENGYSEDDVSAAANSLTAKAKSMVNGLHRSADMYTESINSGANIRSLEHKIQELKVEKQVGEISSCPSSADNDQDSPLDFSVKRRSSFSGSLSDDSMTSSSPGHATDYRASASPVDAYHNDVKRETPSPDGVDYSNNKDTPHHISSGIPPLAMFPNLHTGLLDNASVLNAFSQMSYIDPRNKKTSRPFKAYRKEALPMPLGFFGIPGLGPTSLPQGGDSGMFAGMNSEDIIKMYNQVQMFREKPSLHSPLSSTSPNGKSSPHLQLSNYNHSPSLPQSTPTSMSQMLTSTGSPSASEHLRTSIAASPPFPSLANSASLNNATIVSSTSSMSHSSSSSSRKRPRSLPDEQKDAAYWERRRKNNDAAKRSRDARRAKEDEIAIRAALLEQENLKLRVEVAALKSETARLRSMLYKS